jgi:hypothetical protein
MENRNDEFSSRQILEYSRELYIEIKNVIDSLKKLIE